MPPTPTLADQVSRLYDLVAGYHATHLMEIARELGVWEALTRDPGLASRELADRLGTDPFYTDVLCRTAFSFGLLERDGDSWRMAPHFDQILGNPELTAPGSWTWAAAAAGGWCRSPSGSPGRPASGSTSSPTRSSWPGG
jgi:hypothetical protein